VSTYYGKYRGKVHDVVDPLQLGRVQVSVPAVLGEGRAAWAMPCVPYAGEGVGLFLVPPVGANVWVEFEAGDPDLPILAGCFWGTGEVPASPAIAETKVLKTDIATVTIDDLPGAGSLTIELASGAKISIGPAGVEVTSGRGATVALTGPKVSLNDGALEVI